MNIYRLSICLNKLFYPIIRYIVSLSVIGIVMSHGQIFASGKNEVGLRIGYFIPKGYEAYFPLQSKQTESFIHIDNALIDVFYQRKINSGLNIGFDFGFTGVLDHSDNNTVLDIFPMSLYALKKIIKLYGLNCYAGGGLNYWYMETKEGPMQGRDGYHLRLDFKYQFLVAELGYSAVNNPSETDPDIGGWELKIGVAFNFSYK